MLSKQLLNLLYRCYCSWFGINVMKTMNLDVSNLN